MSDTVIRVENISKLYRLCEVGTGSLAHDVNRWWHKVRGKEDPYLKIGEVNDRTKPAKQARADGGSQRTEGATNHTKKHENLTADCSDEHGYGTSGGNQWADSGEFLEGHSQASLQMDSKKLASIRSAHASSGSGQKNGSDSESAKIIKFDSLDPSRLALRADLGSLHLAPAPVLDCGKKSDNSALPASDWVYALKDVSFEVKRGELRTLGRSEKEISKKCLGATKVPDSGRRRHQLLGIIGRNGAARKARGRQDSRTAGRRTGGMTPMNQAAGQPLGRLPQAARRVRRRGKARINSTLLKILSRVTTQTEGRIKECLGKMKDVAGLESEISKVLASPEFVLKSQTDAAVKLFYEFYAQTIVGGKWLCVVVRYSIEPPDAFVVTAYLTNKPKQGKILWQKN